MSESGLTYAENIRLHFDPEKLLARPAGGFSTAAEAAQAAAAAGLPHSVPWPANLAPVAQPLNPAPAETDSLSRFANYDAVVMTYTSAEAASLAALFTPNHPVSTWYEYRHNIGAYLPLVTGHNAPFNSTEQQDQRYFHSLGLYFPCTIGNAKVLLFKSGLHMDYDSDAASIGPNAVIPFFNLVTEVVEAVSPKVFITTGTGGGVGSNVKLGDVVVGAEARFDCTAQFKSQPWAQESYPTTPMTSAALSLMTPALLQVNAKFIADASPIPGRPTPTIWSDNSTIVTTDVFAFDTSNNYFKLQNLGQACDMGDAMAGRALSNFHNVKWHAIRNASDPQVPMAGTTEQDYKNSDKEAGNIYKKYGGYTTAASVIATWAVIASL